MLQPFPLTRVHVSKNRIDSIFRPASMALVGASDRPGSIGALVRTSLAEGGFQGPIHYVNPSRDEVAGQRAYASVRDLPEPVDLAVVVTPAATVPDVITHCGERGVKGAVVIASGFRENGAAGQQLELEI